MKNPSRRNPNPCRAIRQRALVAALAAGLLLGPAGGGQAWAADEPVSLNFVNAEIDSVVRAVGKISGRNFVIDPRVKGSLNIASTRPVAPALTYEILLSALRVHGFAAIETNGVTLIVPEADAKLHFSGPARGKGGDRIVTEVIALDNESAAQMLPVLKPMVSPNNHIAAVAGANLLVVTDYAENLRRLRSVVEAIDRAGVPEPAVIPLKHASAPDLVPLLNRLSGDAPFAAIAGAQGGDPARRMQIIPDLRSNSLLVQAPSAARLERLKQLVDKLDVPAAGSGNMRVVYLKNAEATRLAQTLRAILSADASATGTAGASAGGKPAASGVAATGGEATTPGIVQADAATNSLIITAPEPTFNMLRATIEKLDMRRAQVFVEALIAEVSTDKATEFGIQWNATSNFDGGRGGFGGTNFTQSGSGGNVLGLAANPASAGRGLNIGVVKGTITLPGADAPILNLGALARALESDTRTNILSTPNLLTLDSEEAKIVVGQNVPFITGSYAQTGGTTTPTPFQTIERKDVGLTLKVKPQITEGGAVRMQVFQEVSSVSTDVSTAGLITNKRSVESNVVVDDGDFVVLGGLIQDSVVRTADKVPWLGDLPWIGWLFRYETQKRVKTNLMVFLRPVVVRAQAGADKLAADRYDYLIDEQKSVTRQANTLFSNDGLPQLPERDGITGLPPSPGLKSTPARGTTGNAPATAPAAGSAPEAAPSTNSTNSANSANSAKAGPASADTTSPAKGPAP
jgi:general secretion pathway protein D